MGFDDTAYQKGQIGVVNEIERQVANNQVSFSTVSESEDYGSDPRICLTGVHFPSKSLIDKIQSELMDPLMMIERGHYYYPSDSLHMTVKNIRTISDPPNFTEGDVKLAAEVFDNIVPKHKSFRTFFYRLLLFKSSLALIGTTDEELDRIHLDLDKGLREAGIPDDKIYTNENHFFCNMTLVRFSSPISGKYRKKAHELSDNIRWDPYVIDSVTLLVANAVMGKRNIIGQFSLEKSI
ncbi:MAG: hypothetical protein ACOYUB_03375 [Patescibacteria group bacterium]